MVHQTVFALLILPGLLFSIRGQGASSPPDSCALLISPRTVLAQEAFRVLAVSEERLAAPLLQVDGPGGRLSPENLREGGGPPFWWEARFRAAGPGIYGVALRSGEAQLHQQEFPVANEKRGLSPTPFIWEAKVGWSRPTENLYAAWIERLFLEALEGTVWPHLHGLIRDAECNILFNHLDQDEDRRLILVPDCADYPFFLRAYFAWKLGLPYGHHRCDRGTAERAPRCYEWSTNTVSRRSARDDVDAFQSFARSIMNSVHSGSARTALDDDEGDFFPVALNRSSLRPGVVFADPHGHTLILVRWIPQTPHSAGKLLATDAQPDGTIAVKRFWQGNFLFSTENVVGEAGFKAFRPIRLDEAGMPRPLNNSEIAQHPDYGSYSLEQREIAARAFYDRMDRLINPEPLDPVQAFRELHDAVYDRLKARALAVTNGEKYMKQTGYQPIAMPSGARIFQTSGPWEDYSTPARDMRLLISLDVLLDFPAKVARAPDAYRIPPDKSPARIKSELETLRREWAPRYTIAYTRSDGSKKVLSLEDVLHRMPALEMGYNPNDCIEIRWGAPEGGPERAACSRRAPADQRERMRSYRSWFRDRIIPVR
jgi:hypothetical protein